MFTWVTVEPGVRIFVNDINPAGSKTILFIHGWPGNSNLFEYQYNILPSHDVRCIGIDMRGYGRSDKPWGGYDYNRLADDLRIVMEEMNLNNITLAGHSTGGAVAIRYMSRHQAYGVSKLALFAAAAPSLIQLPYFPYGQTLDAVNSIINQTDTDRPGMLNNFKDMFFYQQVSESFGQWFLNMGLEASSYATIAIARAWLTEELFSDLPSINVPTLILHGIHDEVCLYPLALAQSQLIPDPRLITFENSGHGLFYDEKDKFNTELLNFIL
jgi:non-heme chloroperoxidase